METKEIPTLHERLKKANRNIREDMFKLERKSASVIHKLKVVTLNTETKHLLWSDKGVLYQNINNTVTYSFEI